ncbi:MAG: 6-phosphofructokinase, partial [Gemmatimonadota bacterium]
MARQRATYGILTGGGDCPGLNAVLRAATRYCVRRGVELIGYRNGWEGVIRGDSLVLDGKAVKGILPLGGTILGTSRTDPLSVADGVGRMRARLEADGVEGLIVVGGNGTLSAAHEISSDGFRIVGVPKTIDNDLGGTDFTFGFDTAVNIATTAVDRLHTTAEAHKRVIVVEVMGHHVGWIAAYTGIAGGADVILVPEYPFDVDAVCERIAVRERRGRRFSIVVIAEGARPRDGDGSEPDRRARVRPGEISYWLAGEIERCIDTETRTVV